MNMVFISLLIQLIVILSSISFTGAVAIHPLSPASRRLGYSFFVPLVVIGFVKLIYSDLGSNQLILIASYSMPLLLLLLTLFRNSFKTNQQMIFTSILITSILVFFIYSQGRVLMRVLDSPVIMTLLIVMHLALIFILRHLKRSLDYIVVSFLLAGNLIIVYRNVGIFLPVGYAVHAIGYMLALKSIYTDFQALHTQTQTEQQELLSDFKHAVEKEVRRRTKHVEWVKNQIQEKSKFDDLTGALSKKPLLDLMDSYIHSREMRMFTILMFDIDKFKNLNDNYGHVVGDKCLKDLVSIAKTSLRGNDSIGRYGGDEFFIILPDLNAIQAKSIAERYRENVREHSSPNYSISMGMASYPWDGEDHKTLIKVADDGLYKSKELGRNCVSYTGYLNLDQEPDNTDE